MILNLLAGLALAAEPLPLFPHDGAYSYGFTAYALENHGCRFQVDEDLDLETLLCGDTFNLEYGRYTGGTVPVDRPGSFSGALPVWESLDIWPSLPHTVERRPWTGSPVAWG